MRRDNERKKTEERERRRGECKRLKGGRGAKEGSTTNNLELLGRCMRGNGGRSISAPKD